MNGLMRSVVFFLLLIFFTHLFAASPTDERKVYRAVKTNPHPPTIDGKINDSTWNRAAYGDGFIQVDPVEGNPPSKKTYFKICYDQKNLYILIYAYDSEPDKISRRLSRRDDIQYSDFVGVVIDSYFDRRTGFGFTVTAGGVRGDAIFSNDNEQPDNSWDPIWEAKTSVTDSGWIAEMRIPFSQLRFAQKSEHIWGLNIFRYIYRKQELTEWQLIPKDAAGFVSYFGYLKGIKGIKAPRRIELLPYSVSRLSKFKREEGNPFATGRNLFFGGGLDGKIGLTGDLTVDFTINPDFGQVEADPSEMNLTAFETFFEEKRPFFIEGKNIFEFPLGIGDGGSSREKVFYSRRIGRQPRYYPDLNDGEYADVPEQTSILGAAKLSGKTSGGWSVGILDALTADEKAQIDRQGNRDEEKVEPLTNYFVGRIQKDLREGNSTFGMILTATNRNIKDDHLNFLNKSAYTGGIDLMHQWHNKTYYLDLKVVGSYIRGHQDALLRVQTSSARYFQRPDANYVHLDSSRTSLCGHGGSVNIGKVGNGKWRYVLGGIWRSPGLELNDLGFLQQADRFIQYFWVGYREFNPVGIFRRIDFNINQWNDDGISHTNNIRFSLSFKPSNCLNITLNPTFTLNIDNLQYVTTEEINGNNRYIMARLKQKTLGIVFRFNYSITPNLSIQFYGQPFVSAGNYSHFKRITHPKATDYQDRFETFTDKQIQFDSEDNTYYFDEDRDGQIDYSIDNPNFNFKQFRSNLVIRWEYKPGSQLYLVWSQDRTTANEFGDFSLNRDVRDLFQVFPENIFLIKLNHWFSL